MEWSLRTRRGLSYVCAISKELSRKFNDLVKIKRLGRWRDKGDVQHDEPDHSIGVVVVETLSKSRSPIVTKADHFINVLVI